MNGKDIKINRHPAVAGQFYPAHPDVLQREVESLFSMAAPQKQGRVRAVISPHAGYIFSGTVAASAFNQLDDKASYRRVFLIASSHQAHYNGASVYCDGDFIMPYGRELVDTEIGEMLTEVYPELFTDNPSPHLNEHSIEVQLPFLHYKLQNSYRIVPIIIGTNSPEICKRLASALKPYLNKDNLFVISSDFSHYPAYEAAKSVDSATGQAIISNSPQNLLSALDINAHKHIPQLVTSLCGWTSVLTLLYMTENEPAFCYNEICYKNSGDAKEEGSRNQVVGYWAISVTEKQEETERFTLSDAEKQVLLKEARDSIGRLFRKADTPPAAIESYPQALRTRCVAFVSIHNQGELRGCYGHMEEDKPLLQNVREMAQWAAARDSRFRPVTPEELNEVDIEISVLSPLRKIRNITEIEMGVHGIFIRKGMNRGVFLPQVATETGWSKESFLGHCARDKAGIGWNGWKEAEISVFTATIIREKE